MKVERKKNGADFQGVQLKVGVHNLQLLSS